MSSTASAVVTLECVPVKGGVQATGRLKFSSGVDAAEWLLLLAATATPPVLCLVPRSDFEIEDDWHVLGLRGTGSKSVVLNGAVIPEYRTVSIEALLRGRSPAAELYPDNPFYRAPFNVVLNTLLLSPTSGMARGLLELFEERVQTRIDGHTGQPASNRPGTQLRFAEAAAEVDAAILVLRGIFGELREWGVAEAEMPLAERARIRRNVCYSARLCLQAADRLLESGDASGMFASQPLQRWARDIHMAGLQASLTWDEPAMSFAQARWGLPPQSRMT
jgi:3-hydroxy-9,10-secoandrosta-1,3,5(10)-triene-9,17-dione monooxygenase